MNKATSKNVLVKVGLTLGLIIPQMNYGDTDAIASLGKADALLLGRSTSSSFNAHDLRNSVDRIQTDRTDRTARENNLVKQNQDKIDDINKGDSVSLDADEYERQQKRDGIRKNEEGFRMAKSVSSRLQDPPAEDYDDSSLSDVCAPAAAPGKPNLQMLLAAYKSFKPAFEKLKEDGAKHYKKLADKGNEEFDADLATAYANYMKKLSKTPEKVVPEESEESSDLSQTIRVAKLEAQGTKLDKQLKNQGMELIERFVNPKTGLLKSTHDAELGKQALADSAGEFVTDAQEQVDTLKAMFLSYNGSLIRRQKAVQSRMQEAKSAASTWISARDSYIDPTTGKKKVEDSELKRKMKQYDAAIAGTKVKDISKDINAAFDALSKTELDAMDKAAKDGNSSKIYGSSRKFMVGLAKVMNTLGQKLNGEGGPIDACETMAANHVNLEKEMNTYKEQAKAKLAGNSSNSEVPPVGAPRPTPVTAH